MPKCKFDDECKKENCPYLHPNGKKCLFGEKCTNKSCPYKHPKDERKKKVLNLFEQFNHRAPLPIPEYVINNYINQQEEKFYEKKRELNMMSHEHKKKSTANLLKNSDFDGILLKLDPPNKSLSSKKLPIHSFKDQIMSRLKKEKVLIVTAETGSGKTTQIPQYAAECFPDSGLIVSTQPRVLAAISLAKRVAQEIGESDIGENVGFKVGGGKGVKGKKIMFMTDGILIRKARSDPLLSKIKVLIIDEAHERSLNTDLLLGITKVIREKRPKDFYVIITSATINPKNFLDFFFGDHLIKRQMEVPGRVFDIKDIEIANGFEGDHDALVKNVIKVLENVPYGNCLVFLPGVSDIEKSLQIFKEKARTNWRGLPLYSSLPNDAQDFVMSFNDRNNTLRMVVFCTNIAETSLTVPNTRIVIDTGLAYEAMYDPIEKITIIQQVYISKSSAKQRRGRAGRTAEGVCVRFYDYNKLTRKNIQPEIMRSNLDLAILQILTLKLSPFTFPYIEKPQKENIDNALKNLKNLGYLEKMDKISEKGKIISRLPFDPIISDFVRRGHEEFDEGEKCAIAASIITAKVFFFLKFFIIYKIIF